MEDKYDLLGFATEKSIVKEFKNGGTLFLI